MKAAVYEGIERIAIKDVPIPKINEREILVRIKCCAICGTDIRIYHHGNPSVIPPTITGHEFSKTLYLFRLLYSLLIASLTFSS